MEGAQAEEFELEKKVFIGGISAHTTNLFEELHEESGFLLLDRDQQLHLIFRATLQRLLNSGGQEAVQWYCDIFTEEAASFLNK